MSFIMVQCMSDACEVRKGQENTGTGINLLLSKISIPSIANRP